MPKRTDNILAVVQHKRILLERRIEGLQRRVDLAVTELQHAQDDLDQLDADVVTMQEFHAVEPELPPRGPGGRP